VLLLAVLACIPVPSPDLRRPATLVVVDQGTPDLVVKACTWTTRHSPLDGCENFVDGMAAVDGIGVREWSTFPLILKGRSPAWADVFVACRGTESAGAMVRLPGYAPSWDETIHITLGETKKMGESSVAHLELDVAAKLASGLCAGTIPLLEY
jgi:hypothetical protein